MSTEKVADGAASAARDRLHETVEEYRRLWGAAALGRLRADVEECFTGPRATVGQVSPKEDSYAKSFPEMIGRSPAMCALYDLILKVAPTDATVLIHGESGTGKELVAQAIHRLSRRRTEAFVAENCAALTETLLESELFGHTRGAFTGADRNRKGRFACADKGTLFLDEVGDMSQGLQKKLLRALQEGEIRPVGASRVVKVDVRFLSASNKDLTQLVEAGSFRDDLYWRLSPIRIDIPPLRDRGDDILLLIDHISAQVASEMGRESSLFTADARAALSAYRWPGNVRELQNEVQRTLALTAPEVAIGIDALSPEVREALGP